MRMLILLTVLLGASPTLALIDCPDIPNLSKRVDSAELVLVGTIARIDDPNGVIADNMRELGHVYCGNVRVSFKALQALKGVLKPSVEFECYWCFLELNGCKASPKLQVGKIAVVFLSTQGAALSIEGGAYGVLYPSESELLDLKKQIAASLGKGP